jgi:hypothetical protein
MLRIEIPITTLKMILNDQSEYGSKIGSVRTNNSVSNRQSVPMAKKKKVDSQPWATSARVEIRKRPRTAKITICFDGEERCND